MTDGLYEPDYEKWDMENELERVRADRDRWCDMHTMTAKRCAELEADRNLAIEMEREWKQKVDAYDAVLEELRVAVIGMSPLEEILKRLPGIA